MTHPEPIRAWHICISGFRQHDGESHGTYQLWRLLAPIRSPNVVVMLREWDSDWPELAETIRLSANGTPARVCIYAYSWGAGYGFLKLSRELSRRGIVVGSAVLCDPVYRSRTLIGRFLAFVPWVKIRVPGNVCRVAWYRQRQSWPRGHDLVAASPSTLIADPVVLNRDHVYMDESPAWHAKVCEVAGVSERSISLSDRES